MCPSRCTSSSWAPARDASRTASRASWRAWTDALPLALPPIVYVMTDLGESTLEDWAANPALEDERLDFARFDVASDRTLTLRRRGIELDRLANPLVVIANYVFDSVPADAFAIGDGTLEECLVSVEGGEVATMELAYSRRPVAPDHYGDADLDALLEHYRGSLRDTVVTVPSVAIGCLRRLRELAGDRLFVLSADKAHSTEESLAYRSEPELSRHGGSFSLMVNFHALGWYARRRGGEALDGGDRHATVDVGAFLFGRPPGGYAETRLAYDEAIKRFSPEDFSILTEGVEARRRRALGDRARRGAAPERLGRVHAARRRRTRCASAPPTPTRPRRRTCATPSTRPTTATTPSRARATCRSRSGCCCTRWRTTRTRSSSSRPRWSSTARDHATEQNIALCEARLG